MLDEMARQCTAALAELGRLSTQLPQQIRAALAPVIDVRPASLVALVGSGDSGTAGSQVRRWHRSAARVLAPSPTELAALSFPTDAVVVATSASGTNPALVEGLQHCREAGVRTAAVTCTAQSPLAEAAQAQLVLPLPTLRPSPAVLTYLASVAALAGLVDALVGTHVRMPEYPAGDDLDASAVAGAARIAEILAHESEVHLIAGYDDEPAAQFMAAKIIEVTGRPAAVHPADDWDHVHRFATPPQTPLVVLAFHDDPGRMADQLHRRGFTKAVLVVDSDNAGLQPATHTIGGLVAVPVRCGAVFHLVAPLLGARLAIALGRLSDSHPFGQPSRLPFDRPLDPR